jgi:hypothetical protein
MPSGHCTSFRFLISSHHRRGVRPVAPAPDLVLFTTGCSQQLNAGTQPVRRRVLRVVIVVDSSGRGDSNLGGGGGNGHPAPDGEPDMTSRHISDLLPQPLSACLSPPKLLPLAASHCSVTAERARTLLRLSHCSAF